MTHKPKNSKMAIPLKMMRVATRDTLASWRVVVAIAAAIGTMLLAPTGAQAAFGLDSFDTDTHTPFGGPSAPASVHVSQAGARADSTMEFWLNRKIDEFGTELPDGALQNVRVDLPPGVVGNPQAVPRCNPANFVSLLAQPCAPSTQVGYVDTYVGNDGSGVFPVRSALYNLEPKRGEVAALGFIVIKIPVRISISLRTDGDYGVTATTDFINQGANVYGQRVTIWGVPADPVHDHQRFVNGSSGGFAPMGTPSGLPRRPFMSLPPACPGPLATTMSVRAWRTADWLAYQDYIDDPATGIASGPTGCERVPFGATMRLRPDESRASTPAAFTATFETELSDSPDGLANAHVKDVSVKLPEGVAIAPGAADGLSGCSDAQLGLGSKAESTCPASSKVGDVRIETQVLDEDVTGEVYLREQTSDRPYRLAVVARANGVLLKLPGEVDPNPRTGQITTTFRNNPQLPFERMVIAFKGGARSPLVTPPACGTFTTETKITSWAGHAVTSRDSFEIDRAADGGPCRPRPFNPVLRAGSANAAAGANATFSLNIVVARGDKELKAIKTVRLPEGLLGNIASVPLCDDALAAGGDCPESSRVGHVQAALGLGSRPLWVPQAGKAPTAVYLAGPYKGAPYSLSIVVPAQAGPFDLGKVVVRSALHVDERTTAITTGIDETRLIDTDGSVTEVLPEALPRILKGIVLNQREIRVIMDREDFLVNPTDCSVKQITAEIYSVDDDRVDVGNPFRAVDCAALGFAPKFRARILDKGRKSTLRSFHPRTRFTVVPRSGDANIGGARVVLPSSTLLDQANIGTTCTRAQMAARNCPEASIVGYAKAWSPLLRDVVEGPVYLAANGGARPLPDLAAVLDGEIRVVLQGEVSTLRTGGKARLQNTFRVVPDAPVSRFELTMRGGAKRGLLVNSADLCRSSERGVAVFQGQNGRTHRVRPRIATTFKGCGKVRRQAARRKAARKMAKKLARSAAIR